jgi:hypothetical protein
MANNRCFNTSNNTIQTASDYSTALKQKTLYSNVAQNMSLVGNANPTKNNGFLYNNNFGVVSLSTNMMAGCLINSQSYDLLLNVTKGQSLYNADNGLSTNNQINTNESWAGNLFSMNYSAKNVKVVVDTSYNAGNTNEIIYPQPIADLTFNNSYPGVIVDPSYLLFYNPCLNEGKTPWLPLVDVSFNNTNYYQTAVKNDPYYNFSYPKKVIFGYNKIYSISIGFAMNNNQTITISSNSGGSYILDNTIIVNYQSGNNLVINVMCQTIDFNDATITSFTIINTNATTLTNINLPLLQNFNCSTNQFTGTLPSFSTCTQLLLFLCDDNTFSGMLPSFGTCTQLTDFYCSTNQFTGTLPSFSTCTQLLNFYCPTNQFTGTLPSFSTCTQLLNFFCSTNQFTGTLPSFFTCTQLLIFLCDINTFSGTLPDFAACTTLQLFGCSSNTFSGTFPDFATCAALQSVGCNSNTFSGTLPSFATCTQLLIFLCDNNTFSGTLPSFATCTAMQLFGCYNNTFSGTLPSFATCTTLQSFDSFNNTFSGTLPSFATCTALQSFSCFNNTFSGTLPSFATCTALQSFGCSNNTFSGTLPNFATCTALQLFDCFNNTFSGTLPSFATCTALQLFYCFNNTFSGTLPSFSTCTQLAYFNCSYNLYILSNVSNFIITLPQANPPGTLIINTQYTIPPTINDLNILSPQNDWIVS